MQPNSPGQYSIGAGGQYSFGADSVLSRALLQGAAFGITAADSMAARSAVASLITLGTPHSGIADANGTAIPNSAVVLPNGQDAFSFEFCNQLSCIDMGEPVGFFSRSLVTALREVLKIPNFAGKGISELPETISQLPPIPIVVGIGITSDRAIGNGAWDDGDYLIRYAGQRLLPKDTTGGTAVATSAALRKGSPPDSAATNQALVYEIVLGTNRDVRPGMNLTAIEKAVTTRKLGYLHSVDTGLANNDKNLLWLTRERDGEKFGVEASVQCDSPTTCQHAGWLIFKNMRDGRYCEFTEAGCPVSQFSDDFSGTSLDALKWNEIRYGSDVVSVAGGFAHFGSKTLASTCGKFTFSGAGGMAVEARMAGSNALRDTHIELIDVATGDRIQGGDTNYAGNGLYSYGTGQFSFPQAGSGGSTAAFKEYRLTVNGSNFKLERGNTLSTITETRTITMPASVVGKTFFLRIGTGGPDYQPGDFDWVRVTGNAGTLAGTCN